ncbi:5-formyltetrahydrofolate cyclo-ligase [Pedobacter sp. SYSU D00535]|uniref:5-formyltetrahydrofolate cyclo-ligase n=1 Tax=Pedobacter sp. SYSU D00535 TaxID=2810308 RepID=UPI001A958E8A
MEKQLLRKLYLEKRKSLTPQEVDQLSTAILKQFQSLDFQSVKLLHTYYPIAGKFEFNTQILTEWLRQAHPEIMLVLSKSDLQNHTLQHIIWERETPLAMNQWGITEPTDGETVAATEIDMVLIPLLAYDLDGNRIGYGKGFYDRFLADCKPACLKVGISFFAPVDESFETNEHDIPLDLCLTPEKIWHFKK